MVVVETKKAAGLGHDLMTSPHVLMMITKTDVDHATTPLRIPFIPLAPLHCKTDLGERERAVSVDVRQLCDDVHMMAAFGGGEC